MKRATLILSAIIVLIVFTISKVNAQSSLNAAGGDLTGAGGSLSFSFGQVFYHTITGTSGSLAEGVQHPFEIYGSNIPETYTLGNQVIGAGELLCFNAIQTITVAGSERPVTIQSDAVVDFIAGQSISFLPGFIAVAGSYVSAQIATDGSFCDSESESVLLMTAPVKKSAKMETSGMESGHNISGIDVRLYPNPNHGQFTVDYTGIGERVFINVYNLTGSLFYTEEIENHQQVSLPFLNEGIYLVRFESCGKQVSRKMIVN